MQLEVIYREGETTRRQSFAPGKVAIGRRADCQVVLDRADVAPVHALASFSHERWVLVAAAADAALEVRGRRLKSVVLGPLTQALLGGARVTFVVQPAAGVAGALDDGAFPGTVHSSLPLCDFDSLLGAVVEPRRTTAPAAAADVARLLRLVRGVAEGLVGQHDAEALLESIVELVFAHVAVERVLLLLGEGRARDLKPCAFRTRSGEPARVELSHTIADEALQGRRALLVGDAGQDARFRDAASVAGLGIRSALCAPLLAGDNALGLLYADRRNAAFTQSDLETLSILAHLGAAALQRQGLQDRLQREQRARARLARYHAPAVVDHVLRASRDTGMLAEVHEVTVLFADLVGFTALSERLPAARVQALLNTVLEALTEEVFREHGTLDKFIGDAVMVFFGAPLPQADHALRAVRTALAMQQRVVELRGAIAELPSLALRVGINTGPATVGEIGAPQRRDYTVIGDTVNVASRLESSVARPGEVVVNATTQAQVAGAVRCRALDEVRVRGRTQPLQPWLIEGLAAPEAR